MQHLVELQGFAYRSSLLKTSCAGTFLPMGSACVFLLSEVPKQFLLQGGKEAKKGCKYKAALDLELKKALSASAAPGLGGDWLCRYAMLHLEKLIASFLI